MRTKFSKNLSLVVRQPDDCDAKRSKATDTAPNITRKLEAFTKQWENDIPNETKKELIKILMKKGFKNINEAVGSELN